MYTKKTDYFNKSILKLTFKCGFTVSAIALFAVFSLSCLFKPHSPSPTTGV